MDQRSRRDFLKDVGTGMIVASVGSSMAIDLGFSPAFAQQGPERLTFGTLEPLVSLMQETPAARLMPMVVERLRGGALLRDMVAAAALANARTFGGEDYVGFHTMMAIGPAFHMSAELPENRRALPVLKVLHRNATRIQEQGGPAREVLRPVQPAELPANRVGGEVLRETVRNARLNATEPERTFAAIARAGSEEAFNSLLLEVQDNADVHRVALPSRTWDLMGIIGHEQAHTLLRQSVRFCVRAENPRQVQYGAGMRMLIPRVLDQHRLIGRNLGTRTADDSWVNEMSQTIFRGTPEQAADAVGAALAEGFSTSDISQAISLAANQLVLRDNGRPSAEGPNKPIGSIHGDGIGVHACDSANAWCSMSRAGNARNKVVCLILGAWQAARDRVDRSSNFLSWTPYPREDARTAAANLEVNRLLPELEEAIRARDQVRAAAVTHRYTEANQPVRPLWDLFLKYAISEDGALHAEKFYRTTVEEHASSRAAFRSRYLIALARVTASAHGYPAPGHAEAVRLLGV